MTTNIYEQTTAVIAELCEKASKVGREYVLQVKGIVNERTNKNKNIPTGDIEIIVNTTPVGMYPNTYEKLIDLTKFNKLESVCDCIYNPLVTGLIYDAKSLNLKTTNGLNMLVAQALRAQEIWLKRRLKPNF